MSALPEPLRRLISELTRLPGVGEKTATRLAHHLLRAPREHVEALASALVEVKDKLHPCPTCGNQTDLAECSLCSDYSRNRKLICVGGE